VQLLGQKAEALADKGTGVAGIQNDHLGAPDALEGGLQLCGRDGALHGAIAEQQLRLDAVFRVVQPVGADVEIAHILGPGLTEGALDQLRKLLGGGDGLRRQ